MINNHPYYPIVLENSARIFLTPCPGTQGVDLSASIESLKLAGASLLLTLMFDEEMVKNNLQSLPALCKQQDIAWLQLPIIDDDVPNNTFESNWALYQERILTIIESGGSVVIHCKGGTGRTGLVAAMILYCYGYPIKKAIDCVQSIRHQALRNKEQLAYLYSFAT